MEFDFKQICGGFVLDGEFVSAERFGTGHINDTFKMFTTKQTYILQRINTAIFKQPEQLMDNFVRVCSHIEKKIAAEKAVNPGSRRRFLQVMRSRSGEPFFRDGNDGGTLSAADIRDGHQLVGLASL